MIGTGDGLRVIDNDVTHTQINTAHSGGMTTAILLSGGSDMVVVNNRITEANFGIYSGGLNWGKYRDNVTVNVGAPPPVAPASPTITNHKRNTGQSKVNCPKILRMPMTISTCV